MFNGYEETLTSLIIIALFPFFFSNPSYSNIVIENQDYSFKIVQYLLFLEEIRYSQYLIVHNILMNF